MTTKEMIPEKFSVSEFNSFPAYLLLWLKLEPYSVPKLAGTPPLAFRTHSQNMYVFPEDSIHSVTSK